MFDHPPSEKKSMIILAGSAQLFLNVSYHEKKTKSSKFETHQGT